MLADATNASFPKEMVIRATQQISTAAVVISLVMAACLVALAHDPTRIKTEGEHSVERGAGMENQKKLEKDVGNAPARRKVAFAVLLLVGVYCALTAPSGVSIKFAPGLFLLLAYLALVAASMMWSTQSSETIREIIRIVVYFGVTFAMARRFRPREMVLILATMGIGSVLFACGFELVTGNFQPWRKGYRLHGSIHTNVLASHAMVVSLATFAFLREARWQKLLKAILISMFMVILLCKARSALFTTFVGMGWIYLVGRPLRTNLLVVSLIVTTITGSLFVYAASTPHVQNRLREVLLLGRSEEAGTLTGRVPLWQELWKESRDHRLLGFGYGAYWTTDQIAELNEQLQWYPGHAHSAYVQTLLDLGFVGTIMLIVTAVACVVRAGNLTHRSSDPSFKFIFGFLLAGFFDGISGVNFVYPRGLGLFVGMSIFTLFMVHPAWKALSTQSITEKITNRLPAYTDKLRPRFTS